MANKQVAILIGDSGCVGLSRTDSSNANKQNSGMMGPRLKALWGTDGVKFRYRLTYFGSH